MTDKKVTDPLTAEELADARIKAWSFDTPLHEGDVVRLKNFEGIEKDYEVKEIKQNNSGSFDIKLVENKPL